VFKPPAQPSRRATAVKVGIAALFLGYASVLAGLLLGF
jgi:hypothetical protein